MSGKRFSRADWLELGLSALAEEGPRGITIDALCRRAGKTKGSFYAHFPDTATFSRLLAEHWREQHTEKIITSLRETPAAQRKSQLDRLALQLDHDAEREMRRLGMHDEAVARVLLETDRARITFLSDEYRESGRFEQSDAEALARAEYALFLAFQHSPSEEQQAYRDSYARYLRIIGLDSR